MIAVIMSPLYQGVHVINTFANQIEGVNNDNNKYNNNSSNSSQKHNNQTTKLIENEIDEV